MSKQNNKPAINQQIVVAVIVGVVTGAIITTAAFSFGAKNADQKDDQATSHSSMSMDDMSRELKDLSGDDFDKAYIEMMIAHHQGAIDMSELSASRAKHQEIKDLSKTIIEAQTKEIEEMKHWQSDWGYSGSEMMEHMH